MSVSLLPAVVGLLALLGCCPASGHPCDISDNKEEWLANAVQKEVVVVGGGVAGLAALKMLYSNSFKNVHLLEAQDYWGGRVKTHREALPSGKQILTEDGAEWIHGGPGNFLYDIAKDLNKFTEPLDDSAYLWMARTQSGRDADPSGFDVAEELMQICERDNVQAQYYGYGYGKCYADKFSAKYDRSPAIQSEKDAWRFYLNKWLLKDTGLVDWEDQSMEDADHFTDWGYDMWNQWADGYDAIVDYLRKGLPESTMSLSSPVCRIFWDIVDENAENKVLVVTQAGASYLADHVILTPSIGHLKERHASLFTPALPDSYQAAMAATELGLCNKVQMGWESAWWRDQQGLNLNLQVIFTQDIPKEMSWLYGIMEYLTIHQQNEMLQGFVTGEEAIAMESIPEATLKKHLQWHLANATGMNVPEPIFFRRSQWQNNVWVRGSYNSYLKTGGTLKNRSPLAKPAVISGKPMLLWAGEHTHSTRYGTVDGAIVTGEREADRIINYWDQMYTDY
ncbi:spermine oxidase-like [Penaeus chinensis]|uniref:spermine oxidase-like n=1 Tax=Penaeus chinensis TaxID=139456 RepID=UPI001FB75040|nr:spermine oxidase-like [Penaeus chinensis]